MATYKQLAALPGAIRNDAFYFSLRVNGSSIPNIILDTGAFELTFNENVAKKLGLPNLGAIRIGGVGGTTTAYQSRCTLTIGGRKYFNVPCIVDPTFSSPGLFGLRFFVDNGLSPLLDVRRQKLFILK